MSTAQVNPAVVSRNWRDLIRPKALEVDKESLTATYGRFS